MGIDIFGVDSERGLDFCDGDLNLYLDILRSYVADMHEVLEKIRNVSAETLPAYAVHVHGVKSISHAIGAEEARKTAKHLEDLANGGNLEAVLLKNGAFIKYAEKLVSGIKAWLEKNDTAGANPKN